jgi:hypothetical protein
MNRIKSEVRGPRLISPMARVEYRALEPGQRLVLIREPDNPADSNAIVVATAALRQPCGYLAKKHAKLIAPEIDAGVQWNAEVTKKGNAFHCPQILLYKLRIRVSVHLSEEVRRRLRPPPVDPTDPNWEGRN